MRTLVLILLTNFNALLSLSQSSINLTDSLKSTDLTTERPKFRWIVPSVLITAGTVAALDKDADESFISNYEVWEERNEKFINFSTQWITITDKPLKYK